MTRVQVSIVVLGPAVPPDSPEASAFLDLVESVWDAGVTQFGGTGVLGNDVAGWHFSVHGGETRYVPEEPEGGAA